VLFGDVLDVMTLEAHSKIQGLKDGGKNIRIIGGIKRNNISGSRSWEDSKARMDRHDEAGVSKLDAEL
jgi:hypothetical protein